MRTTSDTAGSDADSIDFEANRATHGPRVDSYESKRSSRPRLTAGRVLLTVIVLLALALTVVGALSRSHKSQRVHAASTIAPSDPTSALKAVFAKAEDVCEARMSPQPLASTTPSGLPPLNDNPSSTPWAYVDSTGKK